MLQDMSGGLTAAWAALLAVLAGDLSLLKCVTKSLHMQKLGSDIDVVCIW